MSSQISSGAIWVLVGTRPEIIKQVPLYLALKKDGQQVYLIGTGQHKELLDQALIPFNLKLDHNLEVMDRSTNLSQLASIILHEMGELYLKLRPQIVIVQGDTTTAAMAGVAAFWHKIPVAHNEAGLRTYDNENPYPEEVNRRILGTLANLHMAPTELAKERLIKEGVKERIIFVTGNTGIDSLLFALEKAPSKIIKEQLDSLKKKGLRPVFMTAHRRENEGQAMQDWFSAMAKFFQSKKDLALIFPTHPNNLAREAAAKNFLTEQNYIVSPMDYIDCCHVIRQSAFVVTDSGGIQEEASSLGVPTVVCRKITERSEAVTAGMARIVGTNIKSVIEGMNWAYETSQKTLNREFQNIFGDGKSAPPNGPDCS